jgi:hypothetical protein
MFREMCGNGNPHPAGRRENDARLPLTLNGDAPACHLPAPADAAARGSQAGRRTARACGTGSGLRASRNSTEPEPASSASTVKPAR